MDDVPLVSLDFAAFTLAAEAVDADPVDAEPVDAEPVVASLVALVAERVFPKLSVRELVGAGVSVDWGVTMTFGPFLEESIVSLSLPVRVS
jgi:hypothetical protein